MASASSFRLLTARDIEILAALDHCPLTAAQVVKLSQTFTLPFRSEQRARRRLLQLCDAGRVQRWPYATAGQGAPNYYTLSRLGYRLLQGDDAVPPSRRMFDPVGISRQHHTQSLADFVVHTAVAAHRRGLAFTGFYRENTLKLTIGGESLFPDCAFELHEPGGIALRFFVEIDAGSERIHSPKDTESWERKLRFYDRYQDNSPERFRVLILTTRSGERAKHILDAAARLVRNPHRSLFYACSLPAYLGQSDALGALCFRDHRGDSVALVPASQSPSPASSPLPLRALPQSKAPSLPT
jgi:Replication-relaxation